jgi:hypothetical protein
LLDPKTRIIFDFKAAETPTRKRKICSHPMEGIMCKSLAMLAAALAILSLGSFVPAQAGGGATSAPSRYNNATRTASADQIQNRRHQHTANIAITEFSSSSAQHKASKR